MKKKLLSLALVFVMALTLLPTAAFAADDLGEDPNVPPVCAQLDGCVDGQHVPGCPLYTAPEQKQETTQDQETTQKQETNSNPTVTPPPANNTLPADGGANDGGNENPSAPNNPAAPTADTQTHTLDHKVEAVAATCTKPGNSEYWVCKCGKWFSDAAVTAEITDRSTVTIAALGHDYVNGYCTRCPAKDPNGTHTHEPKLVDAKAATCTEAGHTAYYACVCGQYFSMAGSDYIPINASQTVTPAKGHTKPASPVFTAADVSETQHYYTCDECQQKFPESHSFSGNTCTVCGYTRTGSPSPFPSGYVDISNAYVNSYSISVTWYSDMPSGTYFDIYVDGNYRTTVAPSRSSSGYFSYTEDFSHYLGDSYYTVAVYLHDNTSYYDSIRVYNRYYDHDYDYWYDHRYPNSTPGTNSSGIPYASQVNGRYSASEAIRILRNCNHNNLQYDLLNSTSASNSFSDLEDAVKRANNVSVQVNIDRSDVPSAIRNIRIDGAAFNASSTNSTVRLEVGAPSRNRYSGYGYQFSMSLTGVGGDSSLDVPVKITMPVPSNINSNTVRILHYHDSNSPTVIEPKVSGSSMSFTLTGFSDFVVTDSRTDPYYYYYTPGSNVSRRDIMAEHLAVVLPILASMPSSGYVYDDVPPTYWAVNEIAWARDGGMMAGYYDGTFRPYAATTRQELWMVLGRLAGANPADMWAARQWVMSAGISDGQNPHSPLSRQQMIAMLYRYAQYLGVDVSAQASLRGYGDSALISGYARNAMAWAIDQGILLADGNNCLRPQDIATRADFAVYLYRFIH